MIKVLTLSLSALTLMGTQAQAQSIKKPDDTPYYQSAKSDLVRKLAIKPNLNTARNVIIFIGDGMGSSTSTAARILSGQMQGKDGESSILAMDTLPFTGLVKTYTNDSQVADSAPTATAIMSGHKTNNGIIGLNHHARYGVCKEAMSHSVASLIELAEAKGHATGVVTTTRITHATPASAYAHTPDRDWEDDSELSDEAKAAGCLDIARQLVEWNHGDGLELIMGGGRRYFTPNTEFDPEYASVKGKRKDGRNLIQAWQTRFPKGHYVWNAKDFAALNPRAKGPILALFEPNHMQYELDRAKDAGGEPSLADMTRFAIKRLSANPRGYVLLVEGRAH